jgi:hypothetical protein
MRLTNIRRTQLVLFICLVLLSMSCEDDEEPTTTFHGSMKKESDNTPASGVKLTFKGLDVGKGLWPSVEEVSTHTVVVDQSGNFHITIPANSKIDRFGLTARTAAGGTVDIFSGCPDWACENFPVGTSTELAFKVGF